MRHNLTIRDNEIILRPLTAEDAEHYRCLRNRPEVRACFFTEADIDAAAQQRWYASYLEKAGDYMFAVTTGDGTFLGAVALYDVTDTEAELGRIALDAHAVPRRGMGAEVVKLLCLLGRDSLGLKRIYLSLYEDNIPAKKTYERAGFTETSRVPSGGSDGRRLLHMERILERI